MELNKRDLDEGDLFGIRAIQSGFFGGVAQSRPSSVAGDHSPEGSIANTLLGSEQSPKQSPKIRSSSPMSSTLTLPLEPRQTASPLRKTIIADDGPESQSRSSTQYQSKSPLRPLDTHHRPGYNNDSAVNMHLNVPPSPNPRPSTSGSDISDHSPEDSPDLQLHNESSTQSYRFPQERNNQHHRMEPAQITNYEDTKSISRPSEPTTRQYSAVHSQSASLVSESSQGSKQGDNRSSIQNEVGLFTSIPAKSRPVSSRSLHPPRSSSYGIIAPSTENLMQYEQEPIPPPPRIASATMTDWGPSIFQEIDQTMSNDTEERHNHHVSHLSDSSSTYSFAPSAHRQSAKRFSTTAPRISRTSDIADTRPQSQRASIVEGNRRVSDASSHLAPSSEPSSNGNSHRNTKELGDLYDSYWRHSKQGQNLVPPGSAAQRPSGSSVESNNHNRHNLYAPARGNDGFGARRGNHLEMGTVPTIAEVPSPLPSPLPTPTIGKAM